MEKKKFLKVSLGFVLVLVFGLVLLGCDDGSSNGSNVPIRVINETGRNISDVRLTGSDGSVITLLVGTTSTSQITSRQTWGGQSCCWARQDVNYTLSWWCHDTNSQYYAQMGGYCGGRYNMQNFQFSGDQQRTVVLRANNTWELL